MDAHRPVKLAKAHPERAPIVQATGDRSDDNVGMTVDITKAPIHLGRGGTASPVEDFDWSDSVSPPMTRRQGLMAPTDAW